MCKNKQNVNDQRNEELEEPGNKEINNKCLYRLSSFDYFFDDTFNRSVKIYEQTLRDKI